MAATDEKSDQTLAYPKCVIFILLFEFCERFCFHEIFSIVTIYFTTHLQLSENFTVTYYHSLLTLTYLFPVFGAVLTYSFLGKFRLVLYTSCLYIFGVLLLLLSTIPTLNPPQVSLSLVSLVLIVLSAGTLKPCIPLIGGDQFVLPKQQDRLSNYFSTFNLVIVFSALAGKTVAPFLREHIHCFGEGSCFSAAFGLSLLLVTIGAGEFREHARWAVGILSFVVVFCFGGRYYRIVNSEDNVFKTLVNWILISIKLKRKEIKDEKPENHQKLAQEIKSCFRIWLTILPFMVLSGAADIRGTLMFFQAMRMDGNIGFYDILPDQFSVIETVITIPIFAFVSNVVFPLCGKCGLMKRALEKVILGGSLIAISLMGAGIVSVVMENRYPELPVTGEGQIRIYNTFPCDVTISCRDLKFENVTVPSGGHLSKISKVKACKDHPYIINSTCYNNSGHFQICEQEDLSYFFKNNSLVAIKSAEMLTEGFARLRSFANLDRFDEVCVKKFNATCKFSSTTKFRNIPVGSYILTVENFTRNVSVTENDYTLMVIAKNSSYLDFSVSEKMKPDRLGMLWMMPHRLFNCLGEMIATSAVLEFCYSEAPANIKNIAVAGYYLMISAGNIVIIAVEAICPFEDLSYKFFLYAGLLVGDLTIFAALSRNYTRANQEIP